MQVHPLQMMTDVDSGRQRAYSRDSIPLVDYMHYVETMPTHESTRIYIVLRYRDAATLTNTSGSISYAIVQASKILKSKPSP